MNDKQTLTIEAGRKYQCRDGDMVLVVGRDLDRRWLCQRKNGGAIYSVDEKGAYWFFDEKEHDFDLIAEWVEPKRIKGWLNVYAPGWMGNVKPYFRFSETREDADGGARQNDGTYDPMRIACIEIDVLEGAGLNGEAA